MKIKRYTVPILGLISLVMFYSCSYFHNFSKTQNGIILKVGKENVQVTFYSDRIVRIVHSPTQTISIRESLVVCKKIEPVQVEVREDQKSLELESSQIIVIIDKSTGNCYFKDKQAKKILVENYRAFRQDTVMFESCFNVQQKFTLEEGEAIYGLGQHQEGIMNYRGDTVILVQTNVHAVIPFLISTQNYGILWDNYSKTVFRDNSSGAEFWSEVADQIDYYFITGQSMDDVIAGYRDLSGQAPMFGKWAFGYWQSKERYKDARELLAIASEYRKRSIPIDNIVQDWRYWALNDTTNNDKSRESARELWSSMKFHPSSYPNPEQTIKEVHEKYNMHYMISIWPSVGKKTEIFDELNAHGHLLLPETWSTAYMYDAHSESARNIYWKHVKDGLMTKGVDGLWMDGTEPELIDQHVFDVSENAIKKFGRCELGTMARYLNTYSLMTTKGAYENWRRDFPDKRVFILTRSVFAGQQRYAAVTWSGDINATWQIFRKQISAGMNFSMAGVPYWTMDIGAFFLHGHDMGYGAGNYETCEDPAYRELYVRWFQFGAFCPIFRSHGTHTPREVWRFGNPGSISYESLLKFDNLRYRLLPYIYSVAWQVTSEGYTMMRGLAMDFSKDKNVHEINNQFLFGPAMMITPVTEEQYFPQNGITTLEVKGFESYLPAGTTWYDFWSGSRHTGGEKVWRQTPLDIMPVYVKAGSLIPMGPFKQYSNEVPEDPIELRIYPGADGKFILYEDENDNYNYEKGIYSTIDFNWIDKTQTLTIGKRRGEFPGMLSNRIFNVIIVGEKHGTGVEITTRADKEIEYSGEAIMIEF